MQTVYKRQRPRSYLLESFDTEKELSLMISMERLRARINNEKPPRLPKRPTKLPYLATTNTAQLKMQHPKIFDTELPEFITRPRNKYERSLSITRLMYANKLQSVPGKRLLRKLKPISERKRNRMKKSYKMSIKIQRNFRRMQAQRKYTAARNVARRGLTQIQARTRGELQRKKFRKFLLQRKAEYAASIRIQNSFRLHAAKSKLARLKTEHEASVKIQNRFRVQKARGELRHRKIKKARANASIQIQSHIRAKFARDRAGVRRKRHKASVKIQNHIRRKKAWLELERRREGKARHDASVRIQTQFRANRARATVREYRNRRIAAVQIQSLVRMQQAVKRTTIRRARHLASVKIENQFRRKKARDEFNRRKAQKLEREQRVAATKVSRVCWTCRDKYTFRSVPDSKVGARQNCQEYTASTAKTKTRIHKGNELRNAACHIHMAPDCFYTY